MPLPPLTDDDRRPTPTRAQVHDLLDHLQGHADPAVRECGERLRLYLLRRGSQQGFHELLEGIHTRLDRLEGLGILVGEPVQCPLPAAAAAAPATPRPAATPAAPATPATPATPGEDDRVQVAVGPVKVAVKPWHLVVAVILGLALLGAVTLWDTVRASPGALATPAKVQE